jgi:predicted nucleic acid-binding protein
MPDTYLVDTAILIDFLRGKKEASMWLESFSVGELAISVITAAELLAGCRNKQEQKQVEAEIERYTLLLTSNTLSATAWGWYRQHRLADGVGFFDCLIGATAYHYGLVVCTLNDKHFRPLPQVRVLRPY